MAGKFDSFIDVLKEGLKKAATKKGFFFDKAKIDDPSWKGVFKSADRQELVGELKGQVHEKMKAGKFVAAATRIDFLSACERDLRLRARSRLQSFRFIANGCAGFAQKSADYLKDELKKIEK